MTCISLDMTIDAVLHDPVIAAAMRADHVDPRGFERLLRMTARRIDGDQGVRTVALARTAEAACRPHAGLAAAC
jgi:hypothetical protein